jgi:hypothetical protein
MSESKDFANVLLCPVDLEDIRVITHKYYEMDVYVCKICGAEYWDKDELITDIYDKLEYLIKEMKYRIELIDQTKVNLRNTKEIMLRNILKNDIIKYNKEINELDQQFKEIRKYQKQM